MKYEQYIVCYALTADMFNLHQLIIKVLIRIRGYIRPVSRLAIMPEAHSETRIASGIPLSEHITMIGTTQCLDCIHLLDLCSAARTRG